MAGVEVQSARPSRHKESVVLVHGVDSTGPWYQDALEALSPHFDCIPISYDQYARWGKLKVAFDPWLLIVGLVLLATSITLGAARRVLHARAILSRTRNQLERVIAASRQASRRLSSRYV